MVWWWSAPQNTVSKLYSFLCLNCLLPEKFPAGPRVSAQLWGSHGPFNTKVTSKTPAHPQRRYEGNNIKFYSKVSLNHSNSSLQFTVRPLSIKSTDKLLKNTFIVLFYFILFSICAFRLLDWRNLRYLSNMIEERLYIFQASLYYITCLAPTIKTKS